MKARISRSVILSAAVLGTLLLIARPAAAQCTGPGGGLVVCPPGVADMSDFAGFPPGGGSFWTAPGGVIEFSVATMFAPFMAMPSTPMAMPSTPVLTAERQAALTEQGGGTEDTNAHTTLGLTGKAFPDTMGLAAVGAVLGGVLAAPTQQFSRAVRTTTIRETVSAKGADTRETTTTPLSWI